MRTIYADTVLEFGKYKGQLVKAIIEVNPKYLLWVEQNLASYMLSNFVRRECEIRASSYVWSGKRWFKRLPIDEITNLK